MATDADIVSEFSARVRTIPFVSPQTCEITVAKALRSERWTNGAIHDYNGFTGEHVDSEHSSRRCRVLCRADDPGVFSELENAIIEKFRDLGFRHLGESGYNLSELQLVRYGPQDRFDSHRDVVDRQPEPRLLSFVLYLNDNFEGGTTSFTELGAAVRPTTGKALVFPSHMWHQADPIETGEKFAVTFWLVEAR